MSEIIKHHDDYLNPPDPPQYGPCDGCGRWMDNDDLTGFKGLYLCEECIEGLVEGEEE